MAVSPLIPEPKRQFFNNNGDPASGYKLFIYDAGTTTKATTFTESDGLTANANPIILNSRGEPGNGVYVNPGSYKIVLAPDTDTDPPTSPIWTRDNISPLLSGGFVQEQTLTAIAGQTAFTFTTLSYTPGINALSVFVNGLRQRFGIDYSESSSTSVTMTYPLQAGDELTGVAQVANVFAGTIGATSVSYAPATGAASTNVAARLDALQSVAANAGDASVTLTAGTDRRTQRWETPLTATRTVTLATSGAYNGAVFRIVRAASATGAFNLDVGTGPLKSLTAAGQWCDVEYSGTAWILTAGGSL